MTKHTDSELNKIIADLEGTTVYLCRSGSYEFPRYVNNPALTFNLMFKYDVSICGEDNQVYIIGESSEPYAEVSFNDKSEIPRAIIECILRSKNLI